MFMSGSERPEVLIMFSGGLDSTGVLWRYINGDRLLHVHHLYLVNRENRAKAEDRAVSDVVAYMRRIRDFGFSESYHEYPCYGGNFIWDSDIFSFVAGAICLSMPSVREVAVGMTLSDMRAGMSVRVERANRIFDAFGSEAKKVYPLSGMRKREVFDMIPSDLRDLTWSCRTPVYSGDDISCCGRCASCAEMRKIRRSR